MIKLGVVDFDTSHVYEFTKRLNHKSIDEDQWVRGAQVVIGCPGESKHEPKRIEEGAKIMKELGVPLVDRPEDMIGKVDGVLVLSLFGDAHLGRAKLFLEAGIPCFVDKPFTCSVADARKIVELSQKTKVPVFTSSSLRYAPELVKYLDDANHGPIVGAVSFGPAGLHQGNPGLFNYGIHAVEVLYTAMGPGCREVTCAHDEKADVVTGRWKDGRIATVRGNRTPSGYGLLAFTEKGQQLTTMGTKYIYRELLKKVVEFFEKREAPVDLAVSVEIVAFIEAALKSANNHGTVQKVEC
jgi:hypothetical protein